MKPTAEKCAWTQDSTGQWNTGCGRIFEFNEGTPRRNGARFCLYCGLSLQQQSYPKITGHSQ